MLRYLGGVFGIAILVAVFAQSGNFGSAQAFSDGFALAIGASASLSIVAAIVGLWLPGGARAPASVASVVLRETQSSPAIAQSRARAGSP
jgi:hypothetical protein